MSAATGGTGNGGAGNDRTAREAIWRRWGGDEWAAYDGLPPRLRARLAAHAYDPWAANAARLWRLLRRRHADPARRERAFLRHLDACEAAERAAFAGAQARAHGGPPLLPHDAARASVLR